MKEQLEQARKVKKSIDGDIKKVDDVADQLSTKRTKIADAECPNNADLKGQALEKVEGKLQKIAEQLFDINIDPSSPSPKIAQEQQNIIEEAEAMKGKLDELRKKKSALDNLFGQISKIIAENNLKESDEPVLVDLINKIKELGL